MAEGIEVRFFGKLTYYAISIYVLFVLGLLIVCTKRYKARTQQHRQSSTKQKSDRETPETKEDMGLMHSRSNDEKRSDEAVRQRRGKAEKVVRCGDDNRGLSAHNNKTANGQLTDNDLATFPGSFDGSVIVDSCRRPVVQEVLSKELAAPVSFSTYDGRCNSKPESSMVLATSANDDNKNTITGVIGAECEVPDSKLDSEEMGRKGKAYLNGEEVLSIAGTVNSPDTRHIVSGIDITVELKDEVMNSDQEIRGGCSIECHFVDKEVSNCVCESSETNDGFSYCANTTCSAVIESSSQEMINRRLETASDHVQRKSNTTMSSEPGEDINDDVCVETRISQRVKDRIMDFADKLAKEIIFGYDEETTSVLSTSSSQQQQFENVKTVGKVPLRLCQAIANDVCRDAPKAARELEVFCQQLARLTIMNAFEEYSNLPADEKKSASTVDKGGTLLRVDGQRRKIFCSSEDIFHDDFEVTEAEEVQSFSNDIGNSILNNAIKDVKCKYGLNVEKRVAASDAQLENGNRPDIVVNYFQEGHEGDTRNCSLQMRNDSISNLDADDEDDGGEDSCYSDESDREADHQPVILRNKNTLKLKIHSDRPLSGYAEQLVQFLADDDDGLDMFESDEEFDAVLDKLEEKYRDNEGLYTKIQKRRKLSESRRKSESSMDTSRGERKRILSLDRLSDEDWRGGLTSTMSESSLLSGTDTDDALKGRFSDDQLMSPDPGMLL